MGYAITPAVKELQKQSANCQATFFHRYILSQPNVELLRTLHQKLETHFKYHGLMDENGVFDDFKMMQKMDELHQIQVNSF